MKCNTIRPNHPGLPLQATRSVLCLALLSLATSACVSIGRNVSPQSAATPLTPTAPKASAGPMVTDRPDFTESAVTVPQGMIQVEAGQTLTQENRQQSLTFGETLFRVGLTSRLELRLAPNSVALAQDGSVLRLGHEDSGIGFKMALREAGEGSRRWIPAMAMIVDATLPTGAAMFRSEHVLPSVKTLLAWDLSDRVAFSSNVNWALAEDALSTHNEWSASGSVGVVLTERWGAYTEYYGFGERVRQWQRRDYLNGGVTFQPIPTLQLDARVGVGPSMARRDYFVGLGLSRRW